MISHVYNNFARRLNDIRAWEPDFDAFAAHIYNKGGLLTTLSALLMGTSRVLLGLEEAATSIGRSASGSCGT
eukprot:2597706-Rhodomonas_salina.1